MRYSVITLYIGVRGIKEDKVGSKSKKGQGVVQFDSIELSFLRQDLINVRFEAWVCFNEALAEAALHAGLHF